MALNMKSASLLLQARFRSPQTLRIPTKNLARALLTCTSGDVPRPSVGRPTLMQHARGMSSSGDKWLWPAHKEVYVYDAGERYSTRQATVASTFNTKKPLQRCHLEAALQHQMRRLPNMRSRLRWRGDTLWFCESSDPTVDLEVLDEHCGLLDEVIKTGKVPFKSDGTNLWRVKLIPRGEQVPCPVPSLKATFPHQYDYIFRAHHAIGDGIDGAAIMHCFLDSLNSVLSGRPVDDAKLGEYDDKQDLQSLKDNAKEDLRKDSKRFDEVRSTLPPAGTTPLLLRVFPRPDVTEAATAYIERDMDPMILKDFVRNVQAAGVSFNTAFSAVLNTAIVELAKEVGLRQETYTVTGNHAVSLRDLLNKKSKYHIGPYTGHLSHSSHVNPDVKSHFWQYAQELHQEFRYYLKSGLACKQDGVIRLSRPELSPDDIFTKPKSIHHDYTINNLGVISHKQYEKYDELQMTAFYTYNVVHNFYQYNMHQLIVFRDQCSYTLCYDVQYLSAESANVFVDKIQSVIRDVAKSP